MTRRQSRGPAFSVRLCFVLTMALAAPVAAAAEIPVTELAPQTIDGSGEGKISVVDGTAGPEPDRFNVPSLSFFQPTSVTVVAAQAGDDVQVKLGKFNWDESFMGGGTKADGYHVDRFHTQGDVLLSVTAARPGTPYRLIVWTGAEEQPKFAPALVPPSEAGGGMMRWLLIGLAVAAAIAAVVYLKRKQGRTQA